MESAVNLIVADEYTVVMVDCLLFSHMRAQGNDIFPLSRGRFHAAKMTKRKLKIDPTLRPEKYFRVRN